MYERIAKSSYCFFLNSKEKSTKIDFADENGPYLQLCMPAIRPVFANPVTYGKGLAGKFAVIIQICSMGVVRVIVKVAMTEYMNEYTLHRNTCFNYGRSRELDVWRHNLTSIGREPG